MNLTLEATLGDLVTADPRRARVLEDFGIDYCCSGHRTVSQAANDAGLDEGEVLRALDLPNPPEPAVVSSVVRQSAELAHDIVDTHHAYLWEEMPRLLALVEKVHGVHGERHPELAAVHEAFASAVEGLDPHMTREERRVFPAISRLERGYVVDASTLTAELDTLRAEHDEVGTLFKQIRAVTRGYEVPEDSCGSYRLMLAGLEAMELDLHEHIHKENNILFPRVVELLG